MEVAIKINLKPFTVPNFVISENNKALKVEGEFLEAPKFRLKDLDATTLDKMCDEFRDSVFKKAGKQQPPTQA